MSYRLVNGQAYSLVDYGKVNDIQKDKYIDININTANRTINFTDELNKVINKENNFIISKHASLRMNEINFTDEDMKAIERGFEIAKEKNQKIQLLYIKILY